MGQNVVPYEYIRIWDVPYAYGPIYAYGAEHYHYFIYQFGTEGHTQKVRPVQGTYP